MKKLLILLLLNFLLFSNVNSELTIKINRAEIGALPIMIKFFGKTNNFQSISFQKIIQNDLYGSGYFNVLDSDNVKNNLSDMKTQFALWAMAGTNYFLKGELYTENENDFIKFNLYNVIKKNIIFSYKVNLKDSNNIRKISHTISNVVFEEITGIKGIFDTKIAYISTEEKSNKKIYKLHVADIDGYNSVAIYKSSKQIMSPSWSPENKKIAYVSFENNRPEVFIQTLATGERVNLLNNNKSSSAPAWSPDGKYLAYSSSVNGNLEIFIYDLIEKTSKRITNSIGIDTEAEWHPDSSQLFFTSDRSGKPQIYIKNIFNGNAERLTFDGIYNADSNISSDGNYISLVHNSGNGHKIAIFSLKDKYLNVISNGKLDEAPSFAPNNKMILFASKKINKGILVATSNDGRIRKELALEGEDVREPVWSN